MVCRRKTRCPLWLSSRKRQPEEAETVGIVQDNTAASVAFAKPMREGGLQQLGLKLLVDETFTPPLSDCTQLIQKVRSTQPEILLLLPTAIPDDKLCLEKLHELGLGRGRIPVVSNGAHIAAPNMLKNMSKDLSEPRHDRRWEAGASKAKRRS